MSQKFRLYSKACLTQAAADPSHVEILTDDIILLACDSTYVADLVADQFIDDIGGTPIISRTTPLTGKTVTPTAAGAVVNSNDATFPSVPSGPQITQVIIAKDTGDDTTSPLMAVIDAGTGFPDTPNGSDVVFTPDPGTYKLFAV